MFPDVIVPTPVEPCAALSSSSVELWCKNDGVSHPLYGGNKVRKLVRLVAEAKRRGAQRASLRSAPRVAIIF